MAGKLHWVHCARTDRYTLVTCHPSAAQRASTTSAFLAAFVGSRCTTRGRPYDTYLDPDHQLCCAHALRELQAVADATAAGQWCWATQAGDALVAMQQLVSTASSARP